MTADDRPAFDEAAETMKNVIAGIRQWADDDVIAATDKLERAIVDFRKMVPGPTAAGYAVVHLPEPYSHPGDGRPGWWDTVRTVAPDEGSVRFDGHLITRTQARRLAAALLAAADHQEKNR